MAKTKKKPTISTDGVSMAYIEWVDSQCTSVDSPWVSLKAVLIGHDKGAVGKCISAGLIVHENEDWITMASTASPVGPGPEDIDVVGNITIPKVAIKKIKRFK